jgi:ABC-type multidrug transport system ATPase subunit
MIIKTSNLGKRFNREWIFRGLTTEFITGNIYAITGPNGAGKSTLMQVLWGQVPPSEGLIEYQMDNRPIPMEDIFLHMAIATPYMDLIEEFTLREQVEFHFQFKQPNLKITTSAIIEKMELSWASDKPVKQFSSGMKQRLKLGLAMFSNSQALFLDEPSTNLDEASTNWYMRNLLEISANKLILIATNQVSDYPQQAPIINLSDIKQARTTDRQVTNKPNPRIQAS